jgi:hypothetical protein
MKILARMQERKTSHMALMYTPHPAQSRLPAFVPPSLVRAAELDVSVNFNELLEMRRVIEQMAGDLEAAQADLIPFFATGGIPFLFPAMHVLYDRKVYSLVDGSHFHMFPGLSWNGKLDGVDSETFFATEFGSLITAATHEDGSIHIWTMDATFTGNAVRKLITALHRAFRALTTRPPKATVSLLAIIDASRAHRAAKDDNIPLHSPLGNFYLKRPAEYSPAGQLEDRQPVRFVRNRGEELFSLTVEYRVINAIPTEDRAELIGAVAKKETLGVAPEHRVGRLTLHFDNGYSPSGTGGNGIGSNILNYLSRTEDRIPWVQWLNVAALPLLGEDEKQNYDDAKSLTRAGLRMFELMPELTEDVAEGLLLKSGLLDGPELFCLKKHALRQFTDNGGVEPTCFPGKLLRKVLASAKADKDLVLDALALFRVCRPDKVPEEPYQRSDEEMLKWWDNELDRN